jgi:hypothetical protein
MATIKYQGGIKPISKKAEGEFSRILDACGIKEAIITSTKRSPQDQARIMFANLEQFGVEAQKKLYGAAGDLVIEVYAACKRAKLIPEQIKFAMQEKIEEIGPEKVSKHCSEDPRLDIFDVAPSSIPALKKTNFEMLVQDSTPVKKFLMPPVDPAYHIEMSFNS